MRTALSFFACAALVARGVAGVAVYGQCGGIGYTGSTVCEASVCVVVNDWYSQCQPGTAVTTTSAATSVTATQTTSSATPTSTGGANIPRGALTQLTGFGSNPTNVTLYAYVPTTLSSKPALIAAIHWCGGTAQDYYSSTMYKYYADQLGYIVLYPNAPASDHCWDVHSTETLTHDAGGDSLAIANGIRYLTAQFGVDTNKVFATGTSSGAMMTNVLAGAYPDLVRAGAAFAGVPYACFAGPYTWSMECSTGQLIKTPQEWGDLARAGYPGYTGPRTRMQLWHGSNDTVLYTQNFYEEIKQWTNVFGVSQTPTATVKDWPLPGWDRSDYGPNVQAILANGVDHGGIYVQAPQVLQWFGLL